MSIKPLHMLLKELYGVVSFRSSEPKSMDLREAKTSNQIPCLDRSHANKYIFGETSEE